VGKVLFMAFWNARGTFFLQCLDCRATVNADCYCTTQQIMKEVIWRKHHDLLTEKVISLPYRPCHSSTQNILDGTFLLIHHTGGTLHVTTSTSLDH